LRVGDKIRVREPGQLRSQAKYYIVVKPCYSLRSEPAGPSASTREYTVVIGVSLSDGIVHEPLSKIHLTPTQAAELLKEGVVREGCHSRQRPSKRRG
jgi:hypothetical protein